MFRELHLSLSEETFAAICRGAQSVGRSPAEFAAAVLDWIVGQSTSPAAALARFECLLGCVDLGSPTGLDNAQIDLDIASEWEDHLRTD